MELYGLEDVVVAIQQKNAEKVHSLLTRKKMKDSTLDVDDVDSQGRGLLHRAVVEGDEKVVEVLLSHGCNVDNQDDDGITPLHLAAKLVNIS
jgi:ankyrin repeat protein